MKTPSVVQAAPLVTVLLASLVSWAVPAQAGLGSAGSVVILGAERSDLRIALVQEAIAFWNETFHELDLEPAFAQAEIVIASPSTRTLENYAYQLSRLAGRHTADFSGPAPPGELLQIEGDVVVFLSSQDLMPVAWRLPQGDRFFLAIHLESADRPSRANITRNVIAHELGHTLGLEHQDDPFVLMCMPCQTSNWESDETVFLPLTSADRSWLLSAFAGDGK